MPPTMKRQIKYLQIIPFNAHLQLFEVELNRVKVHNREVCGLVRVAVGVRGWAGLCATTLHT